MLLGLPLRAWQWIGFLLACLALWAGAVWAVHTTIEHFREQGRVEIRTQWDAAVITANAKQSAEKAQRDRKQRENDDVQAARLAGAAADAARARDAEQRVRQQLAAFVAARRDPGQAQPVAGQRTGEQGADPLDLLANLFSRADDAAGVMGQYADALRIAGERCERGYDIEVTP